MLKTLFFTAAFVSATVFAGTMQHRSVPGTSASATITWAAPGQTNIPSQQFTFPGRNRQIQETRLPEIRPRSEHSMIIVRPDGSKHSMIGVVKPNPAIAYSIQIVDPN